MLKKSVITTVIFIFLFSILTKSKFYTNYANKNDERFCKKQQEQLNPNCTDKMSQINKKIAKNPNNYKYYIERGKLQALPAQNFFSTQESGCYMAFNCFKDRDNAISDYEKALALAPDNVKIKKDIYKLLFDINKYEGDFSSVYTYNDESLYYALKIAQYEPSNYIYSYITEHYKYLNDYYNAEKYFLLAQKFPPDKTSRKYELPRPEEGFNLTDFLYIVLVDNPKYCRKEYSNYKTAIEKAKKENNKEILEGLNRHLDNFKKDADSNPIMFLCRFIKP